MSFSREIDDLEKEIDAFRCRPATLPGDIVLVGLARDVYDTTIAVAHTLLTDMPHKAYANARLLFEAAQSALVLATHEDFVRAGALAWTYYENLTALSKAHQSDAVAPEAKQLATLERRVSDFASGWDTVNPGGGEILQDAKREVWSTRKARPDNWLHEPLGARQLRAYTLFAASTGGKAPAPQDLARVNTGMYRLLCHETHAHPRVHSFKFRPTSDGFIEVVPEDRNAEHARRAIAGCVAVALAETAMSLRWKRTGTVTA